MKKLFLWITFCLCLGGCEQYLDEKPTKAIDTPDSLGAIEALLDNSGSLNTYPTIPVVMGDEFYSSETAISSMELLERNFYLWMPVRFQPDDLVYDWRDCYNQIQNANVALESLEKLSDRGGKWEELKGAALFYRAHAYYNLSTIFLDGPNLQDKNLALKIPVRETSKIVLKPELGDKESIQEIIQDDLLLAAQLLPLNSAYATRPNKQAAKALLARIFLAWEEYELALSASEQALQMGDELMDYKELSSSSNYPFTRFNQEVIWHSRIGGTSYFSSQSGFQVSGDLLDLYREGDLRRSLFFIKRSSGYINFRGSYYGSRPLFAGLAIDELYLILSESLVRKGRLDEGAAILNALLINRYSEAFIPVSFTDETQALQVILEERRKELAFRGLRWSDLRRLNNDERFKTTLTRNYEGQEYNLLPNSEKYVLPIPARELSFY
ncbi:RagB/SusD family nutrient uptake outer membrane protein [Algoriphagus yeomjeoni]|uniref:RagB/SusD family nutrient uptake outer membrane protein n=1 Tax=Algoriphagus yeomjeoni TaxID=291403 RepID=UPI003CE4FA5E